MQSFITISLSAICIFTLVLITSVYLNIEDGLKLSNKRVGADVIILSSKNDLDTDNILFTAEPSRKYINIKDLKFLDNFDEIDEMTFEFFGESLSGGCCSIEQKLRVVGFDQDTDFLLKSWMKTNNISNLKDDEIIIGADLQSIYGRELMLLGKTFKLVGMLHKTGSAMDRTLFVNIDILRELVKDKMKNLKVFRENDVKKLVSAVFINLKPSANVSSFVSLVNNSQDKVIAVSKAISLEYFKEQMRGWFTIVIFLIAILVLNVLISLFGRFNSLVRERRGEIGYLRAIGLNKSDILVLILSETSFMSLIGGFIGSLLALLFFMPITDYLKSIFTLPSSAISASTLIFSLLIGLLISILLAFISSIFSAIKAMNMEPQMAMSKAGIQ